MIASFLKSLIPEKSKRILKEKLGIPSQETSLKNIRRLGFSPKFCLDIGAYEGFWTRDFKQIFPDCAVMMFEGQVLKEPALIKIKKEQKDVDYIIALLGANEAIVTFNIYETASSVFTEHNETNAKIETRTLVTLDESLKTSSFGKPDFIKIDTQGYELEILKGGESTLANAEFVLLEVSFLDIYADCPLVSETIDFMKERGFVVYDICTLMRRPLDKALFQSDFLFVKEGSKFRKNKRWN